MYWTQRFKILNSIVIFPKKVEKDEIRSKCIPHLQEKYRYQFSKRQFSVKGLWFRSGTDFQKAVISWKSQVQKGSRFYYCGFTSNHLPPYIRKFQPELSRFLELIEGGLILNIGYVEMFLVCPVLCFVNIDLIDW